MLLRWYVSLCRISRISALRSNCCFTRNPAAALSSFSLLDGFVMRRSSTLSTRPVAKKFFQMRFVIARAKYGFSGAVSHCASGRRRSSGEVSEPGAPSSGVGGCAFPRSGWTRSPVFSA